MEFMYGVPAYTTTTTTTTTSSSSSSSSSSYTATTTITIISCCIKVQNGLALLIPAYPGCPLEYWLVTRVCAAKH